MTYSCVQEYIDDEIYTIVYEPEEVLCAKALLVCMPFGDERKNVSRVVNDLLREVSEKGMIGAMYDYPGMGESAGHTGDCTLSRCVAGGEHVLHRLASIQKGLELVLLGIRSGSFPASELCKAVGGSLILWHPFLSGERFLRELKLKDKIRGELVESGDRDAYWLNGEEISPDFYQELVKREVPADTGKKIYVMQISPSDKVIPQYKKINNSILFSIVHSPPFWNPHEGWDTSAVVKATVKVLFGE